MIGIFLPLARYRLYRRYDEALTMSQTDDDRRSPDQKRYKVLTQNCGLDHEEALHALGRRTGGFPEYQKLSRQQQLIKMQQLITNGLTQQEAVRVSGFKSPDASSRSKTMVIEERPRFKPGKPPNSCFYCKQISSKLSYVPEKVWLCAKCHRLLRKARKGAKRRREIASYHDALTHPEFRGLKGVRK